MIQADPFAQQFESYRPYLRGVAYRMLGSFDDAEDAVQDSWLRANSAGADGIENVRAWLTTIVSRVCLNMLRARKLVKGYSDTHARGQSKFDRVMTAAPLLASREDGGSWMDRLIRSAEKDESGDLLDGAIRTIASFDNGR